MQYPAVFKQEPECVVVTFRDVPEAVTQAKDNAAALDMAQEVLILALQGYLGEGRALPKASRAAEGEVLVEILPSIAAKILMLDEMRRQKVRPAELARRLGVKPQEMSRITNLFHPTAIDTLARAVGVLGKRLDVRIK